MRSGGDNLAGELTMGVMIALLFLFGNDFIVPYVPIVVVGSMLFYLSFCLVIESFVDTWKAGISISEYLTIFFISSMMMVMGFTEVNKRGS
jgi:MFS superfamily sulfate permease-like transporter